VKRQHQTPKAGESRVFERESDAPQRPIEKKFFTGILGRKAELSMLATIILWLLLAFLVFVLVQRYIVGPGEGVLSVFDGLPGS
jgi:hypothetical protein